MSIYSTLAIIALYAIVAQHGDRFHQSICAAFVVGGSVLLGLIESSIVYGMGNALTDLFLLSNVVTIIIQYAVAFIVFRGIRNSADSDLPAYFGWVAVGWFIIFMAVPFVVGKIL